jgi:hypothetical protein
MSAIITGTDVGIKRMAWGDGTTPVDVGQHGLSNELGRIAISSQTRTDIGIMETATYLGPSVANVHIKEVAWFAGANATDTPGSGVCIARALWDSDKNATLSFIVKRTDRLKFDGEA